MRITCVIGNLGGGGAERMMTVLCKGLASRGHEVTLLTLDNSVADFYTLDSSVQRVRIQLPLFKKAGLFGGVVRLGRMTRALKTTRPDVVISFMTLSILGACLLLRVPYIYADHLDARVEPFGKKWKLLRGFLLRRAKAVTVLSVRDRDYLAVHAPKWKVRVIYNPALPPAVEKKPRPAWMKPGKHYVIAVGRLVAQKGFDLLIKAWGEIAAAFPAWQLAIIGAGPDADALKAQAVSLGIAQRIDFTGSVHDLAPVYAQADLLVMSSRAEGFPMVLLEAMSAGVPAVSFACTGPDVIIRDGVDGKLVASGDVHGLAKQVAVFMQDEPLRREMGANAREVVNRFSLQSYLDAYENLCKHP